MEFICDNCEGGIQESDVERGICPACRAPLAASKRAHPMDLALRYQKTGRQFRVASIGTTIVGREAAGSDVLRSVEQVGRRHCRINATDSEFRVFHLGSRNGTFIERDGKRILVAETGGELLRQHDLLLLGREVFSLEWSPVSISVAAPAPRTAPQVATTPGIARAPELRCGSCNQVRENPSVMPTESGWKCQACDTWNSIHGL